ncbi:phage tail tape measure protein [Siphonobacter sp. SORGH_AS_0500]|uniref:phage tail tape measure protein n=1 Tax=Siphonobacter sp. SORGH_AS_0500 TaxID=1864824 RepID=UPI0028671B1D|nr:phage tail tape measure protein [Siphonobacter sp. SORGH_AS_0500]MDR6196142.1 TP901 family phage tail tape measure protein [Siphonobacter sp. SORGH_AS_0500]
MSLKKETAEVAVVANMNDAIAKLGLMERKVYELNQRYNEMGRTTKKNREEKKALKKELDEARLAADAERKAVGALAMSSNALRREIKNVGKEISSLSPTMIDYEKRLEALKAKEKEYTEELKRRNTVVEPNKSFFQKMKGQFDNIKNQIPSAIAGGVGGALVGVAADMLGGMISSIEQKIEKLAKRSDEMTDLAQAFGMTTEQAKQLNKEVGDIDNRLGPKKMREIATEAGKLGIPTQEVKAYTEAVGQAAVAMESDFPGGVAVLTQDFTKVKGLFSDTKEMKYADSIYSIGSAMKALADEGTATAGFQVDFLKRMGQIPETLRPGIKELMGYAAVMEEAGLTSEIASSGLADVLMVAATKSGGFAKLFNMSKESFEKFLNTKPNEFLIELTKKLAKMSGTQAGQTLDELGVSSKETVKALGSLTNDLGKLETKQLSVNKAFGDASRLTEIFSEKNDNLAGKLERAGNALSKAFNESWIADGLGAIAEGFSDLVLSMDTAEGRIEKLNREVDSQTKVVGTLDKELIPLLDKYDQISASDAPDKQKQLKELTAQISEIMPTAVAHWDAYGNALSISTGKARELIEAQRLLLQQKNKEQIDQNLNLFNDYAARLEKAQKRLHGMETLQYEKDGQLLRSGQYRQRLLREGIITAQQLQKGTVTDKDLNNLRDEIKLLDRQKEAYRDAALAAKGMTEYVGNRGRKGGVKPETEEPKKPKNGLENFDPSTLGDDDKSAKSKAEQLAKDRLDNEVKVQHDIVMFRLEAIKDEREKEIAQADWKRELERQSMAQLVKEKKMSQTDYDRWLKASDQALINEINKIEAKFDKKEKEEAEKATKKVAEAALEETVKLAQAKLEVAKAGEDLLAEYRAELDVLTAQQELENFKATAEQKLEIEKRYLELRNAAYAKYQEKQGKADKKDDKEQDKEEKKSRERIAKQIDLYVDYANAAGKFSYDLFSSNLAQQDKDNQIATAKRLKQLEAEYESGKLSKEQYESAKTNIERESARRSAEIKRKQLAAEKTAAIFSATLNAISAGLKAWAQGGGIGGSILAGLVSLATSGLIAKMKETPEPEIELAEGGRVEGKRGDGIIAKIGEAGIEQVTPNWQMNDPVTRPYLDWLQMRNDQGYSGNQGPAAPSVASPVSPIVIQQSDPNLTKAVDKLSTKLDNIQVKLSTDRLDEYLDWKDVSRRDAEAL